MLLGPLLLSFALASGPAQLTRDLQQGSGLLAKGAVAEAVTLLREVVRSNPTSADAHLMLGRALALIPRREEAIAELSRAVEMRPGSAEAHNTLGMALARFAELESARREFERAIAIDAKLIDPHMNLALILAQNNELAAADDQVARALALCGGCTKASYLHYLEGKIFDKRGMSREAARAFEAAIRLRRDFADAYIDLSSVKLKLRNEQGAIEALEAAVGLAPENAEARYRLGVEYLGHNNAAGAVEQLREAYRLKPEDRGVVYNFSRALRAGGQGAEADAIMKRLAALLKFSSRASEQLLETRNLNDQGVDLEKSGQISAAIEKYRSALEIDPLSGAVRRNLGLALCRLGRWDEGVGELKETLRMYPDDTETTRALYIALDKQAAAAGR